MEYADHNFLIVDVNSGKWRNPSPIYKFLLSRSPVFLDHHKGICWSFSKNHVSAPFLVAVRCLWVAVSSGLWDVCWTTEETHWIHLWPQTAFWALVTPSRLEVRDERLRLQEEGREAFKGRPAGRRRVAHAPSAQPRPFLSVRAVALQSHFYEKFQGYKNIETHIHHLDFIIVKFCPDVFLKFKYYSEIAELLSYTGSYKMLRMGSVFSEPPFPHNWV